MEPFDLAFWRSAVSAWQQTMSEARVSAIESVVGTVLGEALVELATKDVYGKIPSLLDDILADDDDDD